MYCSFLSILNRLIVLSAVAEPQQCYAIWPTWTLKAAEQDEKDSSLGQRSVATRTNGTDRDEMKKYCVLATEMQLGLKWQTKKESCYLQRRALDFKLLRTGFDPVQVQAELGTFGSLVQRSITIWPCCRGVNFASRCNVTLIVPQSISASLQILTTGKNKKQLAF